MSPKEFFILYFFIHFKNNLLILFFDCGGLRCCIQASSRGEQGLHFFVVFRLFVVVAFLVAEHRLQACRLR